MQGQAGEIEWQITAVGRVGLRPDGIVCAEITADVEQSPSGALENLSAAFIAAGNKRRPMLVDLRGARPLGPATRGVYSKKIVGESFTALAMIIHLDLVSRSIANLYLHVAKLPIPTKIFSEPADAVEWLKKYFQK